MWIIAGQSNAAGENGADGQEVPWISRTNPGLFVYQNQSAGWSEITDVNLHYNIWGYMPVNKSIGPAIAFGRTILNSKVPKGTKAVGFIPVAFGGTNLAVDWQKGSKYYNFMVSQAKLALNSVAKDGNNVRLRVGRITLFFHRYVMS